MLKKTFVKSQKVWKVKFILPKEEIPDVVKIETVHLVGDFNGWNLTATSMKKAKDMYTTTLELKPGLDYYFRYLINGKIWINERHADDYVPNSFGSENCVVNLLAQKA